MLSKIGPAVLGLFAVVLAILGFITSWPIWGVAVALVVCLASFVFALLPEKKSPDLKEGTVFIKGDENELKFRNVFTDADKFLEGNANRGQFQDITHKTKDQCR
jgi:hypothetical protein